MGIHVNMKFLVLAAAVAVSSAQLVTYPNGAVVPADEPAVAAAKAQFAAAGGVVNPVLAYAGYPYLAGYPYAAAYGYPYGGLVAHPNGAVVPVDEPAVAAAKADFAAAGGVVAPAAYAAYPYAAAPAVAAPVAAPAVAAPVAAYAAAPARDAVLTTIKLNPGHATFYRVD